MYITNLNSSHIPSDYPPIFPKFFVEFYFYVWFNSYSVYACLGFSSEPFSDGVFEARTVGIGIETLNRSFPVGFFSDYTNILSEIILNSTCHNFRSRCTSSVHKNDNFSSCKIDKILSFARHPR